MKIIVCNHCGKPIPETYKRFFGFIEMEKHCSVFITPEDKGLLKCESKKFDLCTDCYKKIMEFLEPNGEED